MNRYLLCLVLSAPAAWADGCPPAPDHQAAIAQVYDDVRNARTQAEGQRLAAQLWEFWLDAPDAISQEMLDQGMRARRVSELLGSRRALDRLVGYCPLYSEGYNQRAFTNFLAGDYDAALPDLDQALELNPDHTGALTGKALTLIALDRVDEAQPLLRDALDLNPWLSERALLTDTEL